MPDLYGPFDAAAFAQAQWYRDAGPATPSGVIGPPSATAAGGELGLTAAGFGLSLSVGRARVRGAAYERTGSAWTDTVPANSSSAGPRNDLIVLRRSLTAKTVVPTRLQGTAAATPTDPAITQAEDGTWDLPLFRVQAPASSGTPLVITDLRPWIATADLGWTNVAAMGGSWVNFGSNFPPARYRKLSTGQVEVQGMIKSGTISASTVVFTLPAGYRPMIGAGAGLPFATLAADLSAELRIDGGGNVYAHAAVAGATPSWFSLQAQFTAEQ